MRSHDDDSLSIARPQKETGICSFYIFMYQE